MIRRRTQFELDKALKRQHILEGLLIALGHLDEVIETIRASASADDARSQLMEKFGLSEAQASAILDMQLRRLAALERQKIDDEYQEKFDDSDRPSTKKSFKHMPQVVKKENQSPVKPFAFSA